MGRIKTLQTDASMFSTKRYRKLIEENNNNNNNINNQVNNNNSNLIRMKLSQDYIAYCCGQCGHHQKFDVQVNYSFKKKTNLFTYLLLAITFTFGNSSTSLMEHFKL